MSNFLLWNLLLPAVLTSQNIASNFLKIVVLDVKRNPEADESRWDHNMTGNTKNMFAVIQWKEIYTDTTRYIHTGSMIANQSYDVMLFTPGLCDKSLMLDAILPKTFSFSCMAITRDVSRSSPMGVSCFTPYTPKPPAVRSGSYYCVYRYDTYKKVKVILSIISHLEWKNVIILYENDSETAIKSLTEMLSVNAVITLYNIDSLKNNSDSFVKMLNTIYQSNSYENRNLLVICSQRCINTIIQQANDFDEQNKGSTALRVFSKWLISDFNTKTQLLDGCNLFIDNIAVVNFPFTNLVDSSQLKPDFVGYTNAFIKNLIDENIYRELGNLTEFVYESLETDLLKYTDCWRAEIYTLLWKPEGRLFSPVGHVNYSEHVKLFPDVTIFPNTKFGFNKRVFLTATNEWKPFTFRMKPINGTARMRGYAIDIFNVLAASLNFTYVLIEPEDGEWGRIKNGSWTGVVGQLHRREVELFVGSLAVSADRETACDFTFPYFHVYTCVIFRLPDPNKTKWRKLLDPLSWEVHLSVACCFLGIIILLYTIERLNPFYQQPGKQRPAFQGMVLYLFGALLTQGGSSMPSSTAGRSLLAAWWIFCLITVATYSGNLIAFLTVSKDTLPFETLQELGLQREYKWGTLGGSLWVSLIKESNLTVFKRLWNGIVDFNQTDKDVLNLSQDVQRHKVETEDYGYIADKTTAEAWVFDSCELTYLKELFFPMNYAFALQNNSPYLHYFNDEIMKIYESGLAETLKRPWWPKRNKCLEQTTVAKKIELLDIQSAFYVIGIGIVLASIVMLVERCFRNNEHGASLRYSWLRRIWPTKK